MLQKFALGLTLPCMISASAAYQGYGTVYSLTSPFNGNCNFMRSPAEAVTKYAALNAEQWEETMNCGRCVEVSCTPTQRAPIGHRRSCTCVPRGGPKFSFSGDIYQTIIIPKETFAALSAPAPPNPLAMTVPPLTMAPVSAPRPIAPPPSAFATKSPTLITEDPLMQSPVSPAPAQTSIPAQIPL